MKKFKLYTPVKNWDKIRASSDWSDKYTYIVIDQRPKVGDWYINTFVSEKQRSVQRHTKMRTLLRHSKDYRFKYCMKIISTDNPVVMKSILNKHCD